MNQIDQSSRWRGPTHQVQPTPSCQGLNSSGCNDNPRRCSTRSWSSKVFVDFRPL